jgi:CheY-like chemotaxis protein/HAMP domain-containing protein
MIFMKDILSRLPIRTKFLASSVLTLILISLFIFVYYPSRQKQLALKTLEYKVRSMAEMVALGVGVGLGSSNYSAITEAMKLAKGDSALSYIVVLDSTGEEFATYNPNNLRIDTQNLLSQNGIFEADNKLHAVVPIRYQNAEYGTLILGFSLEEVENNINRNRIVTLYISLAILIFGVSISLVFSNMITKPIIELRDAADEVAKGNRDVEIRVSTSDEIGVLGNAFNAMIKNIKQSIEENEKQNWLKSGLAELNDKIRGEQDVMTLSPNVINYLATYLEAKVGAIYLVDENNSLSGSGQPLLKMVGSYAYTRRKNLANEYRIGEGLVGQAALEKKSILITNVPDDYLKINSGLGEGIPRNIMVTPFLYEGEVKGIIELGSFHEFTELQLDFLNQATENIAIGFHSAQSRVKMKELLEKTQQQAEELQAQQEELRQTNEELEEQAEALKESQARMEAQQEELRQTNEELEKQTRTLEKQKQDIKKNNLELEKARQELEIKAKDLEITSKYKSEFLANMSHELRTPLNSLLILSKLLHENKEGNLTDKQLEFARTIHSAGTDLLNLINDILDLSKVEAGKLDLNIHDVNVGEFANNIQRSFRYLAKEKGLGFKIELSEDAPAYIRTDSQRVEQIVKNLLSNAFKFTDAGHVTLKIYRPTNDITSSQNGLDPKEAIAIAVSDTGIGVSEEKQKLIFEAFQQGDGRTNRKYGGTGLGLSISKELAKVLGGEIQLKSKAGEGSTFTLYLPTTLESATDAGQPQHGQTEMTNLKEKKKGNHSGGPASKIKTRKSNNKDSNNKNSSNEHVQDDRENIASGDRTILIIEDDPKFANILLDLTRAKGFKCLVAESGEKGIHFANHYKPSAIMLDIGLPGMDGWAVMERLKDNSETRHIPVHFMSASDRTLDAMRMGAIGFLSKPVSLEELEEAFKKIEETISKTVKNLLVVEDDEIQRNSILELIGNGDVKATAVGSGEEAFKILKSNNVDCMILDLGLSDMSGFELLERIRNNTAISKLPIIIYTGKNLTREEEDKLRTYAESIIIKGVKSPERLLDETSLFLHRVEANLSEEKKKMLRMVHDKELILQDKKILLVDDDMRNVFAMASILEEYGVRVLIGKNGKEGLECLNKNPDIDLVLMDIMMPEMDGYEAMGEIRKQQRFKKLPIIALTAKAMKGDRNKCIEAGANDYLAKPIDADKLLSLLRVWLYQ